MTRVALLRRARRSALVAALAAVAASVLVTGAPSYADAGLTVQPLAAPAITEAADYATTAFTDPWDYSNAEDIRAYADATVSGGRLGFTTGGGFRADLIPYIPGAAPIGRDGAHAPLDGRRFTNLSMRLYSSNGGSAAVLWTTCDWANTACRGSKNFRVFPGWQTVVLPLGGAANWTRVIGLKLLPTNVTGTQIYLDWARAYAPETPVDVSWTDSSPGRAATLYWDTDSDQTNNTPGNPGWGQVGSLRATAASNTLSFDSSAYPSGAYYFYVGTGGGVASDTSSALTVVPRPRPTIDTPSMTSGADYATTIRKNAWDMSQPTDGVTQFASAKFGSGVVTARNVGGNRDPAITLAVPTPIAGSRFHYANFRMWIEGPFSIGFEPGGGMLARLTWKVAGSPVWQNTNDIVVYPGWNNVVIDLATSPATKIVEVDQAGKIGWAGKSIVTMRLDPNEDIGRKNWRVDFVRLTETPNAVGAYDIKLHDSVAQPDSTVEIWADKTYGTYGGRQLVSGLPVSSAGTTFHWDPALDVPAGTYWIWVKVRNSVGSTRVYSEAPVTIRPLAGTQ
ncbi:MAG: hypothetical protein QOG49_1084 [Frankiaceae bacterium]|nr:hypothetical protein [Frankiaceae bacterium]